MSAGATVRAQFARIVDGKIHGTPFTFGYNPEQLRWDLSRIAHPIELDVGDLGKTTIPLGAMDETLTLSFLLETIGGGLLHEVAAFKDLIREPWLLLRWGPHRATPLQILSASIEEQLFDPNLIPLRATVAIIARNVEPAFHETLAPLVACFSAAPNP